MIAADPVAVAPLRARRMRSEPVITNEAQGFERAARYLKRLNRNGKRKSFNDAVVALIERGTTLRLLANMVNGAEK